MQIPHIPELAPPKLVLLDRRLSDYKDPPQDIDITLSPSRSISVAHSLSFSLLLECQRMYSLSIPETFDIQILRQNVGEAIRSSTLASLPEEREFGVYSLDGYNYFPIPFAIKYARENNLDEGQFLGGLLGVNPDRIKPAIRFLYKNDGNYDANYTSEHVAAVGRTEIGLSDFLSSGVFPNSSRIYFAGRTSGLYYDQLDLQYVMHEIGHDIFLNSLTGEQRLEFTRLFIDEMEKYKDSVRGTGVIDREHNFFAGEEKAVLNIEAKIDQLGEAFSLLLGCYAGYFFPSSRESCYFLYNKNILDVFAGFFDKYSFKRENYGNLPLATVINDDNLRKVEQYIKDRDLKDSNSSLYSQVRQVIIDRFNRSPETFPHFMSKI